MRILASVFLISLINGCSGGYLSHSPDAGTNEKTHNMCATQPDAGSLLVTTSDALALVFSSLCPDMSDSSLEVTFSESRTCVESINTVLLMDLCPSPFDSSVSYSDSGEGQCTLRCPDGSLIINVSPMASGTGFSGTGFYVGANSTGGFCGELLNLEIM